MYTKTVSAIALLASLGLAQTAWSQTDQSSPDMSQEQTQAAPEQPAPPAAEPSAGATQGEEQSAESAPSQVDGQIVMQDNDTFLSSDFVGTAVYSPNEETLGEIKDLIFANDGTLQGVVIGVGGFLGIGEKSVAINMDRIQMNETDDGIKLTLSATKEELENAVPFKSKYAQKVEQEAEQARQQQETQSGAPGAPGAPNPAAPPSNVQ